MSTTPPKVADSRINRLLMNMVVNLAGRSTLARTLGDSLDTENRDLDKECGYVEHPTVGHYRRLYRRNGIARRVNDVGPDESFAVYPDIYEVEDENVDTRFEKALTALDRRVPLCHYLHRADRLSGIGRYGVMVLGLTGTGPLDRPVPGVDPKTGEKTGRPPKVTPTLAYIRPFSEDQATILQTEQDGNSPRYGYPTYYQVTLGDPSLLSSTTAQKRVHWTRVIHVADNREDSDLTGTPRMEPVMNYLLDLRKIGGGSAEMFWKGAFPGFAFETVPDLVGESTMDEESVKEQFLEYMEGLKRYLALDGVTVKPLLPQTADPTAHARQQLEFICATLKVPLRIFLGSESGHLASTQDAGTWNRRIRQRQRLYLEPMLIRPFLDRLILLGVLPAPAAGDYTISWGDLNTISDKDRALITLQRSQALMQYVSGGCEAVMPVREYLTLILGLTRKEAAQVIKAVEKVKDNIGAMLTDPLGDKRAARDAKLQVETAKQLPKPRVQGGGRAGPGPGRTAGTAPAA